ncbi:MAG: MFS transporter [Verrucomicrobiota bacterium]
MSTTAQNSGSPKSGGILEGVTVYHWLVFILAASGWLFDCMGQRIFILAREPALKELLGATASDGDVKKWGGLATCILMIGWGTGGLLFGMMSDRYGRVKAMVATLLAYTIFSGLSGLSRNGMEFLIYRFLCGMGVGGMFGAATTLVAESVPAKFRTAALGSMQALSAMGNIGGSALSLGITPGLENYWGHYSGWQVIFFVSVTPVLLAIPILLVLKEPEAWKKAKADAQSGKAKRVGSITDLFRDPRWRRSTLVGICLGVSGMVGLWGIGFFSPELVTTALKNRPLHGADLLKPAQICQALKTPANPAVAHIKSLMTPDVVKQVETSPDTASAALLQDFNRLIHDGNLYNAEAFKGIALKKNTANLVIQVQKHSAPENINFLNRQLLEQTFPGAIDSLQKVIDKMRGRGTMLQDVGALLGMFAFTFIASYFNRRKAFLIAFVMCLCVVSFVFATLKTESDIYWMLPLMGFCTLSVFAGYSIYFPEIYPTRLRGTGVGFCYNTVRYLAAPFPYLLGHLSTMFPFRTVAVAMCGIYLIGIVALIWAPETKDQPLPED